MKTTVRRLKLTHYELRVLIEALNAKRLKQRANGIAEKSRTHVGFEDDFRPFRRYFFL